MLQSIYPRKTKNFLHQKVCLRSDLVSLIFRSSETFAGRECDHREGACVREQLFKCEFNSCFFPVQTEQGFDFCVVFCRLITNMLVVCFPVSSASEKRLITIKAKLGRSADNPYPPVN